MSRARTGKTAIAASTDTTTSPGGGNGDLYSEWPINGTRILINRSRNANLAVKLPALPGMPHIVTAVLAVTDIDLGR